MVLVRRALLIGVYPQRDRSWKPVSVLRYPRKYIFRVRNESHAYTWTSGNSAVIRPVRLVRSSLEVYADFLLVRAGGPCVALCSLF